MEIHGWGKCPFYTERNIAGGLGNVLTIYALNTLNTSVSIRGYGKQNKLCLHLIADKTSSVYKSPRIHLYNY